MPLFEFECLECGVEFEKLVRKADAVSEVACPACGSRRVDKKMSTFASLAKGSSSSICAPSGG